MGFVSGIRGNVRAYKARCLGEYAHSGATPRSLRCDAVMAVAEYAHALEREWENIEAEGGDLVLTLGKLYTDPESHAISFALLEKGDTSARLWITFPENSEYFQNNTDVHFMIADLDGDVQATGTVQLLPEPGTLALIGVSMLALVGAVRRRQDS